MIVVLAYLPSFSAPFQFDSASFIANRPAFHRFFDWPAIWETNPKRFLAHLTFAFNYAVHGDRVFGYHLWSLAAHLATGWVLALWLRLLVLGKKPVLKVPTPQAFVVISAAVFLLHPIQTQAVTYVWQRTAVMAALFTIMTLYHHTRYRLKGKVGDRRLAWVCCLAAMFCKEIAFVVPLMVLLVDVTLFSHSWHGAIKSGWPFWMLLPIIPVLFLLNLESHVVSLRLTDSQVQHSPWSYWGTQIALLPVYLRLLVAPFGQRLDYGIAAISSLWQPRFLLGLLTLSGMAAALGYAIRCRNKLILLLSAVVVLGLMVEMGTYFLPDLMFEHRLYLPMLGASGLIGLALVHSLRGRTLMVAASLVVLTYASLTFLRNRVWQSRVGLWQESLRYAPDKTRVLVNLAAAESEMGELKSALEHANQALSIDPDNPYHHSLAGLLLAKNGQLDAALAAFDRSLRLDASQPSVLNHRAGVYLQLTQLKEAQRDSLAVLALDSQNVQAHYNLGMSHYLQGRLNEAEQSFSAAIQNQATHSDSYRSRALVRQRLGRLDLAVSDLESSLRYQPQQPKVIETLGVFDYEAARLESAIDRFGQAMAMDPQRPTPYLNRGMALMRMGQYSRAVSDLSQYLEMKPDPKGYLNRGIAYFRMNQRDLAIADLVLAKQAGLEVPEDIRERLGL